MNRNFVQPAKEFIPIVVGMKFFKGLDKHRLSDIFCILETIKKPVCNIEKRLLVFVYHGLKRLFISAQTLFDQNVVVGFIHKYNRNEKKLVKLLFNAKNPVKSRKSEDISNMFVQICQFEGMPLSIKPFLVFKKNSQPSA